jgi:hypothetical protein
MVSRRTRCSWWALHNYSAESGFLLLEATGGHNVSRLNILSTPCGMVAALRLLFRVILSMGQVSRGWCLHRDKTPLDRRQVVVFNPSSTGRGESDRGFRHLDGC